VPNRTEAGVQQRNGVAFSDADEAVPRLLEDLPPKLLLLTVDRHGSPCPQRTVRRVSPNVGGRLTVTVQVKAVEQPQPTPSSQTRSTEPVAEIH